MRRTRQAWQQVSGILLNDNIEHDANEHVGLLTVIAGVRSVALFLDIADTNAKRLVRLLRMFGLVSFAARGPATHTWESPHSTEITRIFRAPSKHVGLWVCRNPEDARTIKAGVDQIGAGRLLAYPQCCIEANQQDQASLEDALIRAYIRDFGGDPKEIAQAWSEDRKVRVVVDRPDRVPRTLASFPFVQHTACESCLVLGSTPTEMLNSEYRDLVSDVDPELHAYLVRIGLRLGKPHHDV